MRSSWIRAQPKSNGKYPCKRCRKRRQRHTEAKTVWRQRQRWEGWSNTYKPKNARSCKQPSKVEERNRFPHKQTLQKEPALPTPWFQTSGLPNCESIHFCCLRLVVICHSGPSKLVQGPWVFLFLTILSSSSTCCVCCLFFPLLTNC